MRAVVLQRCRQGLNVLLLILLTVTLGPLIKVGGECIHVLPVALTKNTALNHCMCRHNSSWSLSTVCMARVRVITYAFAVRHQ